MVLDVLVDSVQVREDLPVFNEVLGEVAEPFFGLHDTVLHDQVLLHPVRLVSLEHFHHFGVLDATVVLRTADHVLQMLNSMAQFQQLLAFRLFLQALDPLDDLLEEGDHVIGGLRPDGLLVQGEFFLVLPERIGHLTQEADGGELL